MALKADMTELRKLAARLRKVAPDVQKALRKELNAEGAVVVGKARSKANWSTRIPGSIRSSVTGVATLVISAGGKAAPHAAPYEHAGDPGEFRHPVYPRAGTPRESWHWAPEPARPFLHPTVLARLDTTVSAIHDAVQKVADTAVEGG